MGIGDWGLGIGDQGLSLSTNPNHKYTIHKLLKIKNIIKFILNNYYFNNIKVKDKIIYKRNDTFKDSRISLEKKRRKTIYNIMSKFKEKLNFDKRENLNEYNKFMNTLKINLNVTKLRNKSTKFMYE